MATKVVEEEPTTYEKILEKGLDSFDWALNKLVDFDREFRKENLGILPSIDVTLTRSRFLTVVLNVFFTKPKAVKDKAVLSRVCRTLGCGKLNKDMTSQGFTKLVGFHKGVRIIVYTHYCFKKGHVKVVKKGERTRAITTCVSRDEAVKLAEMNGFVIEE